MRVGAAIELIHGYSLVHDDLPAMDDALTRRGRPSCHRQYDEATAILAGDALQTLAFDMLVDPATHPEPGVRCALVSGLAAAAGPQGMCGGQMIDLLAEGKALDLAQILELQRLKTGALIGYACETGALLGGGSDAARDALRAYAADLGLAFQIQDDLLDVTGDAEVTGKDLGRDVAAGKATVVALLGVPGSRRRLEELRTSALAHLDRLEGESAELRAVFDFVISRSS
jgi:farnesyl diphosphate synthase